MAGSKLRVGILGHGFIGSIYHEVLSDSNDFYVASIADPLAESTKSTLQGIEVYDDYHRLLDDSESLDAVINALPTALRVQSVQDTADCGLPMLIEKPIGINSNEAEEIRRIAQKSGVQIMVGMTGRYHPEFVNAFAAMGQIGEITHLDERMHFGGTPFPVQYLDIQQYGRGVGLTNGIHTVDRFLQVMTHDVAHVIVDYIGNDFFGQSVEDYTHGSILFTNGKRGRFSLRWTPHQETDYVFEAVGSDGIIRVYGFDRAILVHKNQETELYRHNPEADIRERHKPGIEAELNAFAGFLRGSNRTKHLDDCIEAQRVIDMFYV